VSTEPVEQTSSHVRSLEVDGVTLRVSESGGGRPILLVMGIGGHLGMWQPLERLLNAAGFRTITYDQPGTGLSTPYRTPRRMTGIARTAETMLDALGYGEVDVLGVSFGGGVAQQLAFQAADRVRRLVLCATSAGMVSVPGHPRSLLALATPRRYRDPEYFKQIAPKAFGGRAREQSGLDRDSEHRFLHAPSKTGYGHQLFAASGWTSFRWLPQLRQPTLVMAGDDDPVVPMLNAHILAWRIPRSEFHVVRGGGHLFLVDQPEDVAPRLTRFLTEEKP
jgi:poly(3-hydroxyalkanoate) depolymerase